MEPEERAQGPLEAGQAQKLQSRQEKQQETSELSQRAQYGSIEDCTNIHVYIYTKGRCGARLLRIMVLSCF